MDRGETEKLRRATFNAKSSSPTLVSHPRLRCLRLLSLSKFAINEEREKREEGYIESVSVVPTETTSRRAKSRILCRSRRFGIRHERSRALSASLNEIIIVYGIKLINLGVTLGARLLGHRRHDRIWRA